MREMGREVLRGILSSNWNNSVNCSARSSNWNNDPLNLNSNKSTRGVTDTGKSCFCRKPYGPLADLSTLLRSSLERTAKYTAAVLSGLVGQPNVLRVIL